MEDEKKKFSFGKLVKFIFFSISAAVYIIFFARFIESCDTKIADDIYLEKSDYESFVNLDADYPLYHYQPQSWTAEDGSVTVTNVYYIENLDSLHLTVRHRNDIYGGEVPFEFKIRVEGIEELKAEVIPERRVDSRSKYTWSRLSADGIVCREAEDVEVEYESFDERGNSVITTAVEYRGGTKVYLDIYNLDGDKLYTFQLAGVAEVDDGEDIITRKIDRVRIRRGKADVIKK